MMDGVIELPTQPDLPPGATLKCMECGTRLRRGQPHTALAPRPHQTLSLLIVNDRISDDGLGAYVRGSHAGITGYQPRLSSPAPEPLHGRSGPTEGRLLRRPLTQGPDLLWHEARD